MAGTLDSGHDNIGSPVPCELCRNANRLAIRGGGGVRSPARRSIPGKAGRSLDSLTRGDDEPGCWAALARCLYCRYCTVQCAWSLCTHLPLQPRVNGCRSRSQLKPSWARCSVTCHAACNALLPRPSSAGWADDPMTRSQALAGERGLFFLDGIVMVTNLGRWHPSDDRSEAKRPAADRQGNFSSTNNTFLIKLDLLSIHCTDNVEWRRGTGGPADPPAPLKLRLPFIHVETATRPNVDVDRRN